MAAELPDETTDEWIVRLTSLQPAESINWRSVAILEHAELALSRRRIKGMLELISAAADFAGRLAFKTEELEKENETLKRDNQWMQQALKSK